MEHLETGLRRRCGASKLESTAIRADIYRRSMQEEVDSRLARLQTLAAEVDTSSLDANHIAEISYLLGKARDATPEYSPEAEASLEKAVKLDPTKLDAWFALAHCKFKKRDLMGAKACLDIVLKEAPTNVKALQLLSMLLRQLVGPGANVEQNVRDSAQRASAAISQCLTDPFSWSLLGSAYLSLFFVASHSADDLNKSRKAYTRASQLELEAAAAGETVTSDLGTLDVTKLVPRYPDLHYNRGVVCMFQEDYPEAIEAFHLAHKLDSSLEIEESINNIVRHARRVQEVISSHGGLRLKKFKELTAGLSAACVAATSSKGQLKDATSSRTQTFAKDLVPGVNKNKYLVLKPLAPIAKSEQPPACIVMIDEYETCLSVSLYHLSEADVGRLSHKDVVFIVDPVMKVVELPASIGGPASGAGDVDAACAVVSFPAVQVLSPDTIFVNGKTVKPTYNQMEMKVTTFDS